MMPRQKLEAQWLGPETQVGRWRVKQLYGAGTYGLVFRGEEVGREDGGWVALKVAWWPGDPRFAREAELLECVKGHPHVPELLGRGEWRQEGGASYPFLVMEWVEGLELYGWGGRNNVGSLEVAGVLAQVARALEATHAAGGVHRDVKGENIRVDSTGRARLMDFGAGNYAGAERLTREGLPPGTDVYRSPEAWEFELHRPRNMPVVYEARPADDVYALGVCGWRLLTGGYPPEVEVSEEEGALRLVWHEPRAPRELNRQVAVELSELVQSMMVRRPEERPSARALAEALELVAANPSAEEESLVLGLGEEEGPVPGPPVVEVRGWEEEKEAVPAQQEPERARASSWGGYVACGVLGAVLATVALRWIGREAGADAQRGVFGEEEAGGAEPAGVGEMGLTAPAAQVNVPSGWASLGLPMPEEPLEGQRRAPHCVAPVEVGINMGCWIRLADAKPPCGNMSYEWSGSCYLPSFPARRKPTSKQPTQSGADGGTSW